ncbi:hypothetical protein Slin15195_G083820 [Septoria linicola]|uniref:Uncharacterized protein n=1 Tax=Septoria linicola TaxID=215465 RepID=A0A9Q9AZV9_9PEZI|nr:hypothetical protein Slin14017_G086330 [Septoria linicola]USW55063.1 hypothetical protein Slin15195_G083820 [Septoria linicola]
MLRGMLGRAFGGSGRAEVGGVEDGGGGGEIVEGEDERSMSGNEDKGSRLRREDDALRSGDGEGGRDGLGVDDHSARTKMRMYSDHEEEEMVAAFERKTDDVLRTSDEAENRDG